MIRNITHPKLLLVEGTHEEKLFNRLLRISSNIDIQVLPILGKYRFREQIEIISKMDNFSSIESLGLVRDADNSFENEFTSLVDALIHANLSAPERPMTLSGGTPKVGIFIAPNNKNPGSIENLLLESVHDDPALKCVNNYMDCLVRIQNMEHPHESKARVQIYLAKESDGELHMGIASDQDIWNWDSPAFSSIKDFLQML